MKDGLLICQGVGVRPFNQGPNDETLKIRDDADCDTRVRITAARAPSTQIVSFFLEHTKSLRAARQKCASRMRSPERRGDPCKHAFPSFRREYKTRFCIASAVSYLNSEGRHPLQLVVGDGRKNLDQNRSPCTIHAILHEPFPPCNDTRRADEYLARPH